MTLTFTQDNNEVFVFEKTSLKADWEFVRGQQNIPLSHKGNHSMRMLAQEFDDIDW